MWGKKLSKEFVRLKQAEAELSGLRQQEKALERNIALLKEELEKLKLDKKIEERDIKHLIKCKEEKNQLELERFKIEKEAEYQKKEMDLQKSYHDKVMGTIKESQKRMEEVYKQILIEQEAIYQTKEMELQKGYHDKVMGTIKESQKRMEEVYKQILAALPNVKVALSNAFKNGDD
jgi:hypothetical protein